MNPSQPINAEMAAALVAQGIAKHTPPPLAPGTVAPMVPQWPVARSLIEQQAMLAAGLRDPAFSTPLHKFVYEQGANGTAIADKQAMAQTQSAFPRLKNPSPMELRNSQVAGFAGGDVMRILRSMQGGDMTKLSSEAPIPLQAYVPKTGYGGVDNPTGTMDKLDRNVANDPEFQRMLARDPERAKFIYRRLVGRDLSEDIEGATDLQRKQGEIGRNYTQKAIEQGATYDPRTRKWKVWNQTMPDDTGIGLQAPRAGRELVDATREQNQWLNEHYGNVTGRAIESYRAPRSLTPQLLQQMQSDPGFSELEKEVEAKVGRPLDDNEKLRIAQEAAFVAANKEGELPAVSLPWRPSKAKYALQRATNAVENAVVDTVPATENAMLDLLQWLGIPVPEGRHNSWVPAYRDFNEKAKNFLLPPYGNDR